MCVCGEGDSHRAEPRKEFTRSPRGFLFVLLIPRGKLPSDSSPHIYTHAGLPHTLRDDQVILLSPGHLPRWDADLPRIIRRLYNSHQSPNSICCSVTSRKHNSNVTAPIQKH